MTIKIDYTLHDAPFTTQVEVYADGNHNRIVIDRVRQMDGSFKWAIRDETRRCLSVEGEWSFESMPSSRPENWTETHRFVDFETAWRKARSAAKAILGAYEDQIRAHNEHEKQKSDASF